MSNRTRKIWWVIARVGSDKFHVVEDQLVIDSHDLVAAGPLIFADAVSTAGELNQRVAEGRLEIVPS